VIGVYQLLHLIFKTDHFVKQKFFFIKALCQIWKICSNWFFKNNLQLFQIIYNLFLTQKTLPPKVTEWNNASLPWRYLLSNHRPLSSHVASAGQRHMASTAAHTAGSLSHIPTHIAYFTVVISSFLVSSTGILKRIKNLFTPKSFILLPKKSVKSSKIWIEYPT
jgi:hypothetical protein